MVSIVGQIINRVFGSDKDEHAIPVLDGGFAPNLRLEQAEELTPFEAPDSLALAADGRLLVSAGSSVWLCEGSRFEHRRIFAQMGGTAGALAVTPAGDVLVAVSDDGVSLLDRDGTQVRKLDNVGGQPLRSVTAIAVAGDGTIYLTDGSRNNPSDRWMHDLMSNLPGSGRVIVCQPGLVQAEILANSLSWPNGVALSGDQQSLLVTEAWAHRLLSISRTGGHKRELVSNLAGYPGRIEPHGDGTFWIAFLSLRTQLVEFMLRERAFCEQMMREVRAEYWVAPSLGGNFHYLEPTQIGQIRKLGIHKPWAPARSYGLVARLDESGHAIESLHSRASGTRHGITHAKPHQGRLLALSKGNGRLVSVAIPGTGA